jgi:hypothetical protein
MTTEPTPKAMRMMLAAMPPYRKNLLMVHSCEGVW